MGLCSIWPNQNIARLVSPANTIKNYRPPHQVQTRLDTMNCLHGGSLSEMKQKETLPRMLDYWATKAPDTTMQLTRELGSCDKVRETAPRKDSSANGFILP